jgi:hypothetical protein
LSVNTTPSHGYQVTAFDTVYEITHFKVKVCKYLEMKKKNYSPGCAGFRVLGNAEAEHAVPVAGGGGARLHHHPLRVQVEGPPLLQQQQQQQRPHRRHQHPAGAHPLTAPSGGQGGGVGGVGINLHKSESYLYHCQLGSQLDSSNSSEII